jgi:hypothetical protein
VDVSGLVAACDDVDVVAVFEELVAEVVDVAPCAACEGPVFGGDKADFMRRHYFRLPVRYLTVVLTAPTNHAADRTK